MEATSGRHPSHRTAASLVKPDRPLTAQAKQLTLEPSNLVGYRSYKVYIELKELREQ